VSAYNAAPILGVTSIAPGDSVQVWSAEQPVPGAGGASASQQVALTRAQNVSREVIFQGFFSGAPGVFEVDCQGSESDVDSQYQTLPAGNITTVDSVNQTFRYNASDVPRFARMLMRSRTNAVAVTASIAES